MPRVRLILDSGAFSAWTRGKVIDLRAYIAFCQEHSEVLHAYVNLDVIPQGQGRARTPAQSEEAAKASYANLLTMEAAGLSPLAVFHQGERFYWLEKLVGEGRTYIGLGGISRAGSTVRDEWLDQCFNCLSGKGVRTHGFGLTDAKTVLTYPWASVDSVSWKISSGYGSIMLPAFDRGSWDYRRARALVVSDKSQGGFLSTGMGRTYDILSAYCVEAGTTIEKVLTHHRARAILNIHFFKGLAKQKRGSAKSFSGGFFTSSARSDISADLMLALSSSYAYQYDLPLLLDQHYYDQLVSYYVLMRGKLTFDFRHYLTSGEYRGN